MNISLKVIVINILCLIFMFFLFAIGEYVNMLFFPKHIIGRNGLIAARNYLLLYVIIKIFFSFIITCTYFIRHRLIEGKQNDSGSRAKFGNTLIALAIFIFSFIIDTGNNFDIHSRMKGYYNLGIVKTISLLSDVCHDISNEKSIEHNKLVPHTHEEKIFVLSEKDKFKFIRTEKCITYGKDHVLTQIGNNDVEIINELISAENGNITLETYSESGFIKSIEGIDDFSAYDAAAEKYIDK